MFLHWNQGAIAKNHAVHESEVALRAITDMSAREHGARRSDLEVEEASLLSWENSIQNTVKEELFSLSPEVSLRQT